MSPRPFLLPLLISAFAASAAERVSFPLKHTTGASRAPSLSADGRFVAFESTARLVPEDINRRSDVYVYDRMAKTTRLVSDDRGGDQPAISANGRFVAYRAFEPGLTLIRVRDLERGGEPVMASFPIDTTSYNRAAELAAISPEGRFVAYVFRPSPNVEAAFPSTVQNQIVIADTRDRTAAQVVLDPPAGGNLFLAQLGRVAMSADGNAVVFDTTDALTADDANGAPDVYRVTIAPAGITRLSKAAGAPDLGGATQPVFALDGTAAFFLAANPLVAADTDARPSIYTSRSADNFATPMFVPTIATPRALAAQATVSGRFIAYLTKVGRVFVRDIAGGIENALTATPNPSLGAPVLSGDDRIAAYATGTVFAAAVPGAPAAHTPPAATVALSSGAAVVAENTLITIAAGATPGGGAQHKLLTVEVDGVERFRTTATALAPQNFTATRGVHDVRSRAFDDAWIEGVSSKAPLIVVPANGKLGITGTTALERTDAADGSATFTATLRIDNRRATPTAAMRLAVTLNATPQKMAVIINGDFALVPDRGESIIAMLDVPPLGPMNSTTVTFSGITPPTETFGDGYQGNGWTVLARLREFTGPGFTDVETATVLVTRVRLNENTELPNTGIPLNGTPSDTNFNAGVLQSLTINGRTSVGERGRIAFTATANFSNGSRACTPQWSLTGPNVARGTINAAGLFIAGNVSRAMVVNVQAVFAGQTATLPVTIKPVVPTVSIVATDPALSESGDGGRFRILRTPVDTSDLTVNYTLSGKATNGADYAMLSGVAVIPARTSAVSLDVLPQQDATFEGEESVIATLDPDAAYRLSAKRAATLRLSDDEPFPAAQPDLALRRGRTTVGSFVVDIEDDEITQTLTAAARKGAPLTFSVSLINRGGTPRDYTLRGGSAAPGFLVRYLDGTTDVTAAVIAGTFAVTQLAPGAARVLSLKITATATAPLGGSQLCILEAESDTGLIDLASVFVERVK